MSHLDLSNLRSRERQDPQAAPDQARRAHGLGMPALVRKLGAMLPTGAVLAVLAGLALWGHNTDWTMPKFSTLVGAEHAPGEDWCQEHSVSESQCIECQTGLVPAGEHFGWCKVHGIAQCTLDHPQLAQLKTTPTITTEVLAQASRALALRPRGENNRQCKVYQRRIQFASTEALDKAGVDIAVAVNRPVTEAIVATGEIIYDQTRTAHLASRVSGVVASAQVQVGSRVQRGDVLAVIDAAEIGRAKGELLQAITQVRLQKTNLERLRPLITDGSIPERQYREAEAQSHEAEIRLLSAQQQLANFGLPVAIDELGGLTAVQIADRVKFLGIPDDLTASFDQGAATSNLFPLRASLDGVVVARSFVPGEVIDTSTSLVSLANVDQMWLILSVRQDEAKYLSLGQAILFRTSDTPHEPEIKGTLAWISTEADEQTRTIQVRANLPNHTGQLRANTFGTGRIVLREEAQAVVVPSEALHSDGDCTIVFVRDKNFFDEGAPKFFHVRQVRIGVSNDDVTEIIAGLLPGEVVASKNSVVLRSQLLRSSLGAGCGCCVPVKN